MTCQHCDHEWKLALVRSGRKFDNISVDMCCDGECEWDQEDAYVWKWCARQRRPHNTIFHRMMKLMIEKCGSKQ